MVAARGGGGGFARASSEFSALCFTPSKIGAKHDDDEDDDDDDHHHGTKHPRHRSRDSQILVRMHIRAVESRATATVASTAKSPQAKGDEPAPSPKVR